MKFRLLGPLRVQMEDGELIPLPQRRRRELLAIFLMCANEPLTGEMLIDALWGEEPPRSVGGALRTHIWALRREPALNARLHTGDGGYQFEVRPGELDTDVFSRLFAEGRTLARQGELEPAVSRLEQALRLWGTPPLGDVPDGHFLAGRIEMFHAQRRAAQDLLIETELSLGRHRQLIPRMRELVAEEPLHEQYWGQLMLALCRCGRRAEALAAYGQARAILAEEYGLEPGAELRRLHQMVLAEAPELDAWPTQALGDSEAGIAGSELKPDQIPPAPTDFVGRTAETTAVIDLLTHPMASGGVPIVVVHGRAGIGKSALAARVAHRLRARFPDGMLYIELGASTDRPADTATVLEDILRALRVPAQMIPASPAGRAGLLRSRTAGRRMLVVIDDAAASEQVLPLLPGTAGCAVLVTGRTRLVGLPGAKAVRLDPLDSGDAVALLRHIIGDERVDQEPETARLIAEACDGLPLAVRIAGYRVQTHERWPLSAFTALFTTGRRLDTLSAEHLSVREGAASSYTALDDEERQLLRLMALTGMENIPEWTAALLHGRPATRGVLDGLVDRHMLHSENVDFTGQPRYRLDPLTADYARERLEDMSQSDRDSALERVIEGWRRLVALADRGIVRDPYFAEPEERAGPPDTPAGVPGPVLRRVEAEPARWFAVEHAGLRSLSERVCDSGRYRAAAELGAHQFAYEYFQRDVFDPSRTWWKVARAAEQAEDLSLTAEAELRVGILHAERGEDLAGLRLFERSLAIFERGGQGENLARSLSCAAYGRLRRRQYGSARQLATRGFDEARRIGDRNSEYLNLSVLSAVLIRTGHGGTGLALCRRVRDTAPELERPANEAMALQNLTEANVYLKRHDEAVAVGRQGLELVTALGYELGEAHLLMILASAYRGLRKYGEAIDVLTRAQRIFARHQAPCKEARSHLWLAECHQACGSRARVRHHLEESLSILRPLRLEQDIAMVEQAIANGVAVKMR